MKKMVYTLLVFILSTGAFAAEIPLGHAPESHSAVLHVNVKRVLNDINIPEAERILLSQLSQIMPENDFAPIQKVFKELLPQLRENGFDLYRNISDLVVSGDIQSQQSFIIGIYGQFVREAFMQIITQLLKLTKYEAATDIEMYYRPADNVYIHYYSETTVIIAGSPENIRLAVQTLKSGRNILNNPDFQNVYQRSDKDRAINIIGSINLPQGQMQNQQHQPGGPGSMAMLMMFMQNLRGINITIDFPRIHRVYIKVFCKDPNTAATIGALVMQQMPMLAPTINQEIIKTNNEIARLSRITGNDYGIQEHILSLKYKKYILLLARYAGQNNIRIRNLGNDLVLECVWPRNVVQNAITNAGIPFNLNAILK